MLKLVWEVWMQMASVPYSNPDINAQDFGREMKKTIPIEKFYTAIFFLLKQNIIFL